MVQIVTTVGLNPMSVFVETHNIKLLPNFHRTVFMNCINWENIHIVYQIYI